MQIDTCEVTIQDIKKNVARVCNQPSHSVPCTGFVGDEFPFIILPLTRDNNERQTQTKSCVASYVIMTSSCTTDRITVPILTYENPVCVDTILHTAGSNMAMVYMLPYMLKTWSLYSNIVSTVNFSKVNIYAKSGKVYITESRNINTVVV